MVDDASDQDVDRSWGTMRRTGSVTRGTGAGAQEIETGAEGSGSSLKGTSANGPSLSDPGASTGGPRTAAAGWGTRQGRRGGAVAVAVLAWFALAWTGWGLSAGVPTAVEVSVVIAAASASAALIAASVLTYRRAASLPGGTQAARGRVVGRRFGLVVAAEFVGLAVVARLLTATHHAQLTPAVICLGVGVHFFPLARLFAAPIYHRTGAALCLVAVLTAVLAPTTHHPVLWTALPGIGAACVLYATCALLVHGYTAGTRHGRVTAPAAPPTG